ncbi:MAG: hypothetical protein JNK75_11805 [Betaproteobacteria bacterium]|nr:hypothetical protein [Betaproteobacteria bacterium]
MAMMSAYRKCCALACAFAIVFAQLAVSAYACPRMAAAPDSGAAVAGNAEPGADCDRRTGDALCQLHCTYGSQAAHDAPPPLAFVALAPSFVATIAAAPVVQASGPAGDGALLRGSAPPLSIRHCCFRI